MIAFNAAAEYFAINMYIAMIFPPPVVLIQR